MGFLRRLFGGGQPASRSRPAPRTTQRVAGTPPSAPPPPPRDDTPGPRKRYLEYVGGSSAKFYAVVLDEVTDAGWRVRFTFGRIGSKREWGVRAEAVPYPRARAAYDALLAEKEGKGYEVRPWPASLELPEGAPTDDGPGGDQGTAADQVLFRADRRGTLPPAIGGSVAGIELPPGRRFAPQQEGGPRGDADVLWVSAAPVRDMARTWSLLAAAFAETGLWPFAVDVREDVGLDRLDEFLMDIPRGRHTEVVALLRKSWSENVGDEEEVDEELVAPFGRQFPGLAARTPGERATSIDHLVGKLKGHLGLVAVHRPGDVIDAIGWMGAANYDADPFDMSTVLRSWEDRFDAYLVTLGADTIDLAVARPPLDLDSAYSIAAEHLAFCPDNITQGAGSVEDYAPLLVGESTWPFWWD